MSINEIVRLLINKLGYDMIRYSPISHPVARRMKLIASFGVDAVLDVGANEGQFGSELRRHGYNGRIISFEPLASAYRELEKKAKGDACWQTFNVALGRTDQEAELNVAGNSQSSSLLEMLQTHLDAAPDSRYLGKQNILVRRLDSMFASLNGNASHFYLKIDTQGFEKEVLTGAKDSLRVIDTIQVEMSLRQLYSGELTMAEFQSLLSAEGYRLVSLEPGFSDPRTGELLQVDGIFHRFTE